MTMVWNRASGSLIRLMTGLTKVGKRIKDVFVCYHIPQSQQGVNPSLSSMIVFSLLLSLV
jgi:hypothetical protein